MLTAVTLNLEIFFVRGSNYGYLVVWCAIVINFIKEKKISMFIRISVIVKVTSNCDAI